MEKKYELMYLSGGHGGPYSLAAGFRNAMAYLDGYRSGEIKLVPRAIGDGTQARKTEIALTVSKDIHICECELCELQGEVFFRVRTHATIPY